MFEPYGSEAFRYFLNFWALTGRGTEARDLAAPILRGELARRSDARLLCRLAERVVWQGGFDQELYSLALEAAQAAHDLLPRDQHIPLIVACAHHRLGDYEEADRWFEQLTRPSQRDALVRGAFMAMNDSRLGQSQAAREALQRLQTAVQARAVPVTPDERTLLAEAEHMLASP
jgi:tetratricopeptide (TPR) repeat protein